MSVCRSLSVKMGAAASSSSAHKRLQFDEQEACVFTHTVMHACRCTCIPGAYSTLLLLGITIS